uniref:BTB domain-containing protein n=1 Tax=Strigamia maritima TaxID=126957 RepID=T1J906_STRMM
MAEYSNQYPLMANSSSVNLPDPIPMAIDTGERDAPQLCKLFIGGINYKSSEQSLIQHFSQWGEIVDCIILRDPQTQKSRGFGFITYKRSHMVDDAQNARPHNMDGRQVDVKRATSRNDVNKQESQAKVSKIYVGGLKDENNIEESHLRAYFGNYGNITKVHIVIDKESGIRRGFGFVEFDDYDPVDKIMLIKQHVIDGKIIDVKKAHPKQPNNEAQNNRRGRGGMMFRGHNNHMRGRGAGGSGDFRTRNANGGYSANRNYGGESYANQGYAEYGSGNQGYGQAVGGSEYGFGYSQVSGDLGVDFGTNYAASYGGGPVKGANYSQRSSRPYGGGRGYVEDPVGNTGVTEKTAVMTTGGNHVSQREDRIFMNQERQRGLVPSVNVTITTKNGTILYAHQKILAASNLHFQYLIMRKCADQQNKSMIILKFLETSPSAMDIVLTYLYTKEISKYLTQSNDMLIDVMSCANCLQITPLYDYCNHIFMSQFKFL